MEIIFKILFFLSGFVIFWAMIGYPISIKMIGRLYKKRVLKKNYEHKPSVTVMVVAHNEEKVILQKLENIIELNYPQDSIEYLISSDNSFDSTNEIVKEFILQHPEKDIKLFEVEKRKGKTNAQNEAQKTIKSDYIVMTDANSMLHKDSVIELMAAFTSEEISYVSGKLSIVNQDTSDVSNAEANYWDSDTSIREIEGRIQSITAGNGALYACKSSEYVDFDPIKSHDSSMPLFYSLQGKRAIANHDAIAYEKAGEVIEDEFGRKVRMNRIILDHILPDIRLLNIFKYKWFSYFYFGHRTCRYMLWVAHLILFVSNLLIFSDSLLYAGVLMGQIIFYTLGLVKVITGSKNKYLNLIYYYCVTLAAQWVGVYRVITGKAKPFWEKAESTR